MEKSSQYTLDRLPNHVSIVVVVVGFKDIDNTPVAVGLEESIRANQTEKYGLYTLHRTQIYEPRDVKVAEVVVVVVVVVKIEEVPRKEGSCSFGGSLCTGRRGLHRPPSLLFHQTAENFRLNFENLNGEKIVTTLR